MVADKEEAAPMVVLSALYAQSRSHDTRKLAACAHATIYDNSLDESFWKWAFAATPTLRHPADGIVARIELLSASESSLHLDLCLKPTPTSVDRASSVRT